MDKISYKNYLLTPHWKKIKEYTYKKYKACRWCGNKENLNIHHLTYEHLWHEDDRDLIVLCEYCHIVGVHGGHINVDELAYITGLKNKKIKIPLSEKELIKKMGTIAYYRKKRGDISISPSF